jgi:hypothetical protein
MLGAEPTGTLAAVHTVPISTTGDRKADVRHNLVKGWLWIQKHIQTDKDVEFYAVIATATPFRLLNERALPILPCVQANACHP